MLGVSFTVVLLFVLLASLGAFFRFQLISWENSFWGGGGLLVANVLGSFALGVAAHFFRSGELSDRWYFFIAVAFLGALTSFSSYSLLLMDLLMAGKWKSLGAVFMAHNTLSLTFCFVGFKAFS